MINNPINYVDATGDFVGGAIGSENPGPVGLGRMDDPNADRTSGTDADAKLPAAPGV